MRRKNRKWVAMAALAYLFLMWCAYRWAVGQRPADGSIFEHIAREEVRKNREKREKEEAAQATLPSGQSRLEAAAPAFFAARYDQTHVVFMVVGETEARFANSPTSRMSGIPTKIAPPAKNFAPLAGLEELWEPDSQSLHFFPEIIQKTPAGDRWMLEIGPDTTVPVEIERAVEAPTGCSLAMGFLASVDRNYQGIFAQSPREYFVVRKQQVEWANPPGSAHIVEFPHGKPFPPVAKQIEEQLTERMQQELAKIDARLLANAGSPGEAASDLGIGARPRLKEWIHADRGLARGEGVLDYDLRGFRLTPDGAPRLYVRARWTLAGSPVFLMSGWFRADVPKSDTPRQDGPATEKGADVKLYLLSADSSWSSILRESETPGSLGTTLEFQSIVNEFDADHDGWAELLMYSDQGASTAITLYLYTDLGLVPMKTPFQRDAKSPESCVDPQ